RGVVLMGFNLLGAQKRVFASNLRPPARLVALALLSHWSEESPEVFPSIPTLQRETGLGRTAVVAAIGKLQDAKAVRIHCKRPMRKVNGRLEVIPNAKLTNHYDLSGLMNLPGREANQFATSTGSGGAPVREGTPTRSRNGGLPGRGAASKEPMNIPNKRPSVCATTSQPKTQFNSSKPKRNGSADGKRKTKAATKEGPNH